MRILYNNKFLSTFGLTASSSFAGFSTANLLDYHLSKYFKFNANSGTIVIDCLTAINLKNIYLLGTNLTSNGSILIEANSENSWSTPAYSASGTIYSNGSAGIMDIDKTYRYWRISIEDTSVTHLQVGYLFSGINLQLPALDPLIEFSYNTNSSVDYSISGQSYGDRGIEYFSSTFNFPQVADFNLQINDKAIATREDILVFWSVNLGVVPIVLIPFDNSLDKYPPIIGLVDQDKFAFTSNGDGTYKFSLKFIETK